MYLLTVRPRPEAPERMFQVISKKRVDGPDDIGVLINEAGKLITAIQYSPKREEVIAGASRTGAR